MQFDYVIVGAGSAGCVLANRLSADPDTRVCLLEAGKSDATPLVRVPAGILGIVPTRYRNWAFQSEPQPGFNGRRAYIPRGRVVGGSSSINAMVYTRGHPSDYDCWAALGNPGWSWADVLPYFLRSENNERGADGYHGVGGPLNVADLRSPNPFVRHFIEAARQAGFRETSDFNGDQQEGVGPYQVTQQNGERCSSARAFLHPARRRPNLTVLTEVHADVIEFEGRRAIGVRCRLNGELVTLRARREIVVSAGAIQSPKLLLLSGIGPAEELNELGIPFLHHLPGVGKNLQDHPDFVFAYRAESRELFGISVPGAWHLLNEGIRYLAKRRGMLTTNFAEAGGFLRTQPHLEIPDVQLHFVIGIMDDHARRLHLGHGYSCHLCLLRPASRGAITLANPDPSAPPRIDPRFFSDPADLDGMVRGFKLARRIMDAPALASRRVEELYTAAACSDDAIIEVLRERSDNVYHPVGTCRMGNDGYAVVDSALRVIGIDRLRVVDASVMPTLIGGNTNAPTIMIAEKASDLIRGAARTV